MDLKEKPHQKIAQQFLEENGYVIIFKSRAVGMSIGISEEYAKIVFNKKCNIV